MAARHLIGQYEGGTRAGEGQTNVHCRSLLGCHARECWVFKDAPVQEFHDVEVTAHDALVLAECVGFGNWDVGLLESVDYAVLAVDLVSCL